MNLDIAQLAVLIGGLAVFLLVAVIVFNVIKSRRAAGDTSQVLLALQPYIYKAILAGEKALVWSLDLGDERLQGMDKKAVADSVYALLPDAITIGTLPIPIGLIKQVVSREVFEGLVKDAYDEAHAFVLRNEAYLRGQVAALDPANIPKAEG